MAEFEDALTQVKKNVKAFKQIIDNRMMSVDKLFSDMAKFLEASKNVAVMLQATGAEIEGNGRANKTTVLGKERGLFKGKRQTGASLLDYYREKIYLIKEIHTALLNINTTLDAEEHLDQEMENDMEQELSSVESAEEKGKNKKIKKLHKLLQKADAQLADEAKRNERDEKLINKEIGQFDKAYKDIIAQAGRLKGLCRSFAKRNYNRIAKYERRERKVVLHIIKNQIAFLKTFSADTKDLIRFLDDYERELKVIKQGRDPEAASLEKELKKKLKHLKKIRKLERRERKFEKSVPKLHKLKDTGESEDADELDHDIGKEAESMEELEQKEETLKEVLLSLEKIEEHIGGVLGQGAKIAGTFDFHLNYVTNSLLSAKKMLRKNPVQVKKFLEKIAAYAEKNVKEDLEAAKQEEEQLRESFHQGAEKIDAVTGDASYLITKMKYALNGYFSKLEKGVGKINKDLEKKFTKELEKIEKQKKDEEKAEKDDKKLRKKTKKSDLDTDRKDVKDMKRQERNLDEEEKKFKEHHESLTKFKETFDRALAKTKQELPSFDGFMKHIYSRRDFKKLSWRIEHNLKHGSDEDKALHKANNELIAWTGNVYHIPSYVEMMKGLQEKAIADIDLLKKVEGLFLKMAKEEHDLSSFFITLGKAVASCKDVHAALGNYENLIKEHLENGERIFNDTKRVYEDFNKELEELQSLEQALQSMNRGNDLITNATEQYEQSMEFFYAHVKEVNKKLGKEEDWGNQVQPSGVESLNQ